MANGDWRRKLQEKTITWPVALIAVTVVLVLFFVLMGSTGRRKERAGQALIISERELSEIRMVHVTKQERLSNVGKPSDTVRKARHEDDMITNAEICFEVTNPDRLDAYTEAEYRILMQEMAWDQ